MKILKIEHSPLKSKRYRVFLENGRHYDFGLKTGRTYIDGETSETRANYWARHMGNKREQHLITNIIPSPALFSAYILWGHARSVEENIKYLNSYL